MNSELHEALNLLGQARVYLNRVSEQTLQLQSQGALIDNCHLVELTAAIVKASGEVMGLQVRVMELPLS